LFELAVERNTAFVDELIVVGNQGNRQLSEAGLHKLGITEYIDIVEATPRNTAPAIAFAALAAQPEDILLVTPADHIIKEGEAYRTAISQAIKLGENDNLVTFGVTPTKPETGYGYIEFVADNVLSFREKPIRKTAEEFISKGNFLWNSGMFCFKAGVFLEELEKYALEVFETSKAAWENSGNSELGMEDSLEIPAISVDYAVMEKSEKIKVVKASFEWSDMGSFEAVYDYLKGMGHPVDPEGNMVIGSNKFTAFVGMQNSILVCTEDANLVLQKEASQDVKKIYQPEFDVRMSINTVF
jgi:mannose-1-phosphate guanylyltransferase